MYLLSHRKSVDGSFYTVNRYHVFSLDDARGRILEGHQQKNFREKEVQEGKNLTLFYRKERGTE